MKAVLFSLFVALLMVCCGEDETEFERIKRLAEEGDKVAQRTLGYLFWNANGAPLDYEEAVKWWRLVADQGHAEAQLNLGSMYHTHTGQGVAESHEEVVKCYRLAADQGRSATSAPYTSTARPGVAQGYEEAVE